MTNCTNCFSGCVETKSDKCVKYTGSTIEFLGIATGDSLEKVEEAITDYLATVLTGEGIVPTLTPGDICDAVKANLPCEECGDYTLLEVLTAIIKTICDLEAEIVVERGRIDDLEDAYDTDCLRADANDGTHAILQEVITTLCEAIGDITTLENLYANCITTSTINTYIANYISTISTSNLMYTKMVPYVVYPFYPTPEVMNSFSITGAGMGTWEKIYMCNGYNGLTPDLRGRSIIGTTNMGGGAFDSAVDPSLGNPNYALGDTNGQNSVILSPSQIAAHTHGATATVNDPGHFTNIDFSVSTDNWVEYIAGPATSAKPILKIEGSPATDAAYQNYTEDTSTKDKTDITVDVVNAENSGGDAHTNIHPVLACHYIMYIP